ncbi:polysaccharide deacetylase family protein [Gellertiella hungarica]|uniref:Chitooligosaccharide deacetylase n=1 Tax=Gellertiella hungarica TaxID=1572859 RepID=A0A7W6J2K4_9HYPH|nr:polysaccharide deacetylase family protein [Gellertiella hungarica]MBB4063611.1 peptidoglycan/xylan/chitin deacetylase (PgdA/CDA1 family) [Gellertiella hungarica]
MKNLLKQAAIIGGLEAISALRLGKLMPAAAGRGLIFTLHHVRPRTPQAFEPNGHLEVTPEFLQAVVEECLAAGLTPIALEDLPHRLADPGDRRRFVAFTLDDGYRNNRVHAAPIFRRHAIPYTIFVTPGFVDRKVTLWWETAGALLNRVDRLEIDLGKGRERLPAESHAQKVDAFNRLCAAVNGGDQTRVTERLDEAALRAGVDPTGIVDREVMTETELRELAEQDPLVRYGGHTLTHPVLSRVPEAQLSHEIEASMEMAGRYGGRKATCLAYPYGTACSVGTREFDAATKAGVSLAVTTRPGVLTAETMKRPTAVSRVSLNGLYQKRRYVGALISGIPFRLKG